MVNGAVQATTRSLALQGKSKSEAIGFPMNMDVSINFSLNQTIDLF